MFRTWFCLILAVFSISSGYGVDTVQKQVDIKVISLGDASGGKIVHGDIAYAQVRILNLSRKVLVVPLAPRGYGKGSDSAMNKLSYPVVKGQEHGGFLAPRIFVRFEDLSGSPVTPEFPLTLQDIPRLEPGGWVTAIFAFLAPDKPGLYGFRLNIDNTALANDISQNDDDSLEDSTFFKEDLVLKGIEVK